VSKEYIKDSKRKRGPEEPKWVGTVEKARIDFARAEKKEKGKKQGG